MERRRLLALAPTFDAGRVVPYAISYPAQTFAFGRFNSDAKLDLVTTNAGGGTFDVDQTIGNGNGTFAKVDHLHDYRFDGFSDNVLPHLQTGDFNGDGRVDLFRQGYHFNGSFDQTFVGVYPGNGDGTFAAHPKGDGARYDGIDDDKTSYTIADVTGDGRSDVIYSGNAGVQVDQDLNGSGNYDTVFSTNGIVGALPIINAVDVTGDGQRDLIFGVQTGAHERLYVTLRTAGGFGAPIAAVELTAKPIAQRFGDFNGDGRVDVAVLENPATNTAYSESVDILLGNGNGTFVKAGNFAIHGNLGGLAVADFDGDGRPDVVVGANGANNGSGTNVTLLANTGNGTFLARPLPNFAHSVDSIDAADFNNDGKIDLILRDTALGKLELFLNTLATPNVATGKVFNDLDADGVQDAGEPGLAGRTVWADGNNNSVLDANESYAITGADGSYRLAFAAGTGTYVRESLPAGFYETPGYSPPATLGHYTGVLNGGITLTGYNFSQKYRGTVTGRIFADVNGNGSFDFNVTINGVTYFESGIAGRTLYLDKNANSKLDAGEPSATSDANGLYGFDVTPGTYNVRDVAIAGELNTTGTVKVVAFAAGSAAYNVNFGHTRPGSIGGTVYDDAGQLGAYVAGDAPLAGVRVFIDKDGDGLYDVGEPTALTDAKGKYAIAGQVPGDVRVYVVKPAGYIATAPAAGRTDTRVVGNAVNGSVDFGLIFPAYVSGRIFADSDANGVIALTEKGVAGFAVFVDYNGNGTPDKGEPLVLSDASGNYALTSARGGNFKVVLRKLAGYNSTLPSTSSRTVAFAQGKTVGAQNFGVINGAFSTAPYKPPVNIPTTSNPTSLAAGDFNKDGKADFIVAGNNSLGQVFLGAGNGSFTHNAAKDFPIGGATRYMVAADVSGDGKIDLIAADQDDDTGTPGVYGGVAVLLGNGDGTFKPAVHYAAGSGTYGVAIADFTGDGKPDLVAANSAGSTASVLINNGNGTFKPPAQIAVPYGATSVAAGDVNKDGKADFVLASASDNSIVVVTGKGNGTFNAPVRQTTGANGPNFVTLADLNADAKLDLIFVNPDANDVVVRLGNGNATFGNAALYATADYPQQVAAFDVDRDGALDLVASCRSDGTADISGGVSIFRGRGDGTFADAKIATAHTSPTAIAVADYNGDGRLDLLAANFFSDDVSLLLNLTA